MQHIGENAELYALGLLGPAERESIDEHVITCDECAKRLGRAERGVAGLLTASVRHKTWRLPSWPLAVAAAFAMTSGIVLNQNFALRGALAADGRSYDALVHSHFMHVPFVSSDAGAPVAAKVIYERNGRWFQIVALRAPDWHVTLIDANGKRQPIHESPEARGATSVLMLTPKMRVRGIELSDAGGKPIALAEPMLVSDNANEPSPSPSHEVPRSTIHFVL